MGLTGSQQAYRQARSGIERAGASRSNYFWANAAVSVDSVNVSSSVMQDSVRVTLALNDEPDGATFTIKPGGTIPVVGDAVIIGLGAVGNPIFGGTVLRVTHKRREGSLGVFADVQCIDWSRLFNRRRVLRDYANVSITTIVEDILDRDTDGFTGNGIEQGLPTVETFSCEDETPSGILKRLVLLAGGGGFYITPDRDLRFFGPGGDLASGAPQSPITLTEGVSTLKAFTHRLDGSQQRNRVIVNGRSSKTVLDIPAGTNLDTFFGLPLPNDGAWFFNTVYTPAETFYATIGKMEVIYEYVAQVVGPPACTTTALASPGDTSIAVDNNTGMVAISGDNTGFAHTGDYATYFAFRAFSGTPTVLDLIPASGYGSLAVPIPAGTPVYMSNGMLNVECQTDSGLVEEDIPAGTPVRIRAVANDFASQAALAGIEGGDGVYEHVINTSDLIQTEALELGEAELAAFADAAGLIDAEWKTTDMQAVPGTQQVINFTGTDALSTTATITHVELSFMPEVGIVMRQCKASNVKREQVIDVLVDSARTPARWE